MSIRTSDTAPERHAHQGRATTCSAFSNCTISRPATSARTSRRGCGTSGPLTLADHKFRAEEDVERATLDEREMQYLYNDGDHYYFMDTSTYEQIHISTEALGDSKDYLVPDSIIRVEFYDVEPVGIELPPTVDLLVKETVPGIKGATASAQVKPATLETGLVVQVPPFVNEGDKIRVNTETGEYQSRV